jgi:hypothetical protein
LLRRAYDLTAVGRSVGLRGTAFCQTLDVEEQIGGVNNLAAISLVTPQHGTQCVARLQQHVHHFSGGAQFVAAQLVEQRLHLVGELGNICKAERGCTALDRVCTAENRVQIFVLRTAEVYVEQHLLQVVEVLSSLFEEDLIEL